MRKSKHALLVLVAIVPMLTGCAGIKTDMENGSVPEPTVLKAYTLEEALTLCDTLPAESVEECKVSALSVEWGK